MRFTVFLFFVLFLFLLVVSCRVMWCAVATGSLCRWFAGLCLEQPREIQSPGDLRHRKREYVKDLASVHVLCFGRAAFHLLILGSIVVRSSDRSCLKMSEGWSKRICLHCTGDLGDPRCSLVGWLWIFVFFACNT